MTPGYIALRETAAWMDLSGRGKIAARGQDRARLLHAMTTNHVEQLQPGRGCYAFFLDAQGHILGDVNLFAMEDYHLLDTEPETAAKLRDHLDRYIIADDVTLEDLTAETATIALEGSKAGEMLASLGAPSPEAQYSHARWESSIVARVSPPGFYIFVPVTEKDALLVRLAAAGAIPATPEDALVVRLEQGRPRYGVDITEKHLPHETQMLHAIHFTKGCYLGQEIVERVRSRGHVNRLLIRLAFDGTKLPEGEVTSSAYSPALGKVIAFAYVRPEQARPGATVTLGDIQGKALAPGPVGS